MLEKKIINWLNKKYEHEYNNRITELMIEYAEDEDVEDLDLKDLHEQAINQLDDDGGMFPNGRDYDSEDY